jgi:thiol-disulfide isomerase/thioredoxin
MMPGGAKCWYFRFYGIPGDPREVRPLSVGARAPEFSGRTADGALRHFNPNDYRKPTVVLFYRGGWCPYCNAQLSDLRLVEPKLRNSGNPDYTVRLGADALWAAAAPFATVK